MIFGKITLTQGQRNMQSGDSMFCLDKADVIIKFSQGTCVTI